MTRDLFETVTGRKVEIEVMSGEARIMADGAPVAAIAAAGLGSAKLRNMARAAARRLACDLGHAARNRRNRKARKGGAE